MPARPARRQSVLLVAGVALAGMAAAIVAAPQTSTATGVVVAVDSRSLNDVTAFTIRTAEGRTIEFAVGALQNGAEFPPGHLVEHIASGVPVLVTYREEGGGRSAVRIVDAPAPDPT
jgi:hypothetical protein